MMRSIPQVILKAWLILLLAACAQGEAVIGPPQIRFGEDLCAQCNMIISDARFAAGYAYQASPGRYQSLAFDDIGDMLEHAGRHPEYQVAAWYVHDYATQEWLDASQAYYVLSDQLATPMGHGLAAHATIEAAQLMADELHGRLMGWEELKAQYLANGAVHGQDVLQRAN